MSVKIEGFKQLIGDLEKRFGKEAIQTISDKALMEGAKAFVKELKIQFETFKDDGYSIEEITLSEPVWIAGKRTIKVHWRGPHGRYRIIHLNELGTVKNPSPRGKGAIVRAMRNSEKAYHNAIADAIRRGL